jgi:hypothetical protein
MNVPLGLCWASVGPAQRYIQGHEMDLSGAVSGFRAAALARDDHRVRAREQ